MRITSPSLLCLAALAPAMLTAQALDFETVKRGVVEVEADEAFGEGIVSLVSPKTVQILTAARLVKSAKNIRISFYSEKGRPFEARLLAGVSESLDLAILEVAPPDGHLPAALPSYEIRENASMAPGEALAALDAKWDAAAGTLGALTHAGDSQKFEFNSAVPGLPGVPLFDNQGRVFGLQLAGKEGEKPALAVKIESAIGALAALNHPTPNLHPFILDGKWRFRASSPRGTIPDDLAVLIGGSAFFMEIPQSHLRLEGECSFDGAQLTLTLTSFSITGGDPPADSSVDMTPIYKTMLDEFNKVLFKEKFTRQPDGSFTGTSSTGVMAGATLRLVRAREP